MSDYKIGVELRINL